MGEELDIDVNVQMRRDPFLSEMGIDIWTRTGRYFLLDEHLDKVFNIVRVKRI